MIYSYLESLREISKGQGFHWWYILPGIFGFIIVFGLPISISAIGALKVFVAVVCAQMVLGLLWDLLIEGIPLSGPRILGAGLAVAAMIVTNLK